MPRKKATDVPKITSNKSLVVIYASILLLILHSYLVAYINSSYIEQFVGTTGVGLIFTMGSVLTVLIFLFVSQVLKKVGNYKATLGFLIINFLAVVGMAFADSLVAAVSLLIIHLTLVPLIIFNLDVFLEANIGSQENSTGSKRGLILALSSLVSACSPLFTGLILLDQTDFSHAYLASAITVLPILILVAFFFRKFNDPKYVDIKFMAALQAVFAKKDLRYALITQFLLQVFFFFMVVYVPLYLALEIELDWWAIGLILFGGQLAYVFFDYPIGIVGDKYLGETEMMAIGFLLLASTTALIGYFNQPVVWLWIAVMFATRIGASLVEVTTESYFFKQIKSKDADIISFFRVTRPLGYVAGALFGAVVLLYLPFNLIFVALGLFLLPGALFATWLRDTK